MQDTDRKEEETEETRKKRLQKLSKDVVLITDDIILREKSVSNGIDNTAYDSDRTDAYKLQTRL